MAPTAPMAATKIATFVDVSATLSSVGDVVEYVVWCVAVICLTVTGLVSG